MSLTTTIEIKEINNGWIVEINGPCTNKPDKYFKTIEEVFEYIMAEVPMPGHLSKKGKRSENPYKGMGLDNE